MTALTQIALRLAQQSLQELAGEDVNHLLALEAVNLALECDRDESTSLHTLQAELKQLQRQFNRHIQQHSNKHIHSLACRKS